MESINIYYGSKKGYKEFLEKKEYSLEYATNMFTVVSEYNAVIRAMNENKDFNIKSVEILVVKNNDFHSFYEHVITSFTEIISTGHKIDKLYLHNPPKRTVDALKSKYGEGMVEEESEKYKELSKEELVGLYGYLDQKVIGQTNAKFSMVSSLYQKTRSSRNKPQVLLFHGPSGVGKTELAKSLSEYMGGKLTRIQFSMMQTNDAFSYIFGGAHNRPSFSSDLLSRESNVVLIDEFDKVNQSLYNAFYEMFDEGKYSDLHYTVDVSKVIFVLTTNFNNVRQAAEYLGMPIFSRVNKIIEFDALSEEEIDQIVENTIESILSELTETEREIILENKALQNWIYDEAKYFKNNRALINAIEDTIFSILTKLLLKEEKFLKKLNIEIG